jgi:hypothetical protein
MYLDASNVLVSDSFFYNNTGAADGGAFYCDSLSALNFVNVTFSSNEAQIIDCSKLQYDVKTVCLKATYQTVVIMGSAFGQRKTKTRLRASRNGSKLNFSPSRCDHNTVCLFVHFIYYRNAADRTCKIILNIKERSFLPIFILLTYICVSIYRYF